MCRAGIAAIAAGWLAAAACAGPAAAGGAEQDPAITVIGNRHIGADVIRSFFQPAPDGQYEVLQFDTDFQNKRSAVETVVLAAEPDGWKVDGYFIK